MCNHADINEDIRRVYPCAIERELHLMASWLCLLAWLFGLNRDWTCELLHAAPIGSKEYAEDKSICSIML